MAHFTQPRHVVQSKREQRETERKSERERAGQRQITAGSYSSRRILRVIDTVPA